MRRINTYPVLAAMLLTVALTGCRQEPLPESSDVIGFVVMPSVRVEAETKADADAPSVESDLIHDGSQVKLFGSYTGTSTGTLFDGTTLTCKESSGSFSWDYGSPKHYWVKDATHDFRAVFPTSANSGGNASKVTVSYDATSANYDLMVASNQFNNFDTTTNPKPSDNKVPLAFHHACAAVRFKFTKSGNDAALTCTITGLKLNNVVTSGQLEYNSTDASAAVALTDWKNPTVDPNGWSLYDGSGWTVPDQSTSPWYFVVPQTLNGPSLEYKYVFEADPQKTVTVTLAIPDKDANDNTKSLTWEPGYTYVYTIDLAMSKVSVEIEPWDVYSVWVTDIPFPEK